MTVRLSYFAGAGWQFFDDNGVILSGGKLFTYAAGTTTPATTYTSSTGTTPHANPIILNAAGRVAEEIWLTSGSSYKFVVRTSTDVLIGTYDNIQGINDITIQDIIISGLTASDVAYVPQGDNPASPVTVADVLNTYVNVAQYDTTTDAAIAAYENNAQMHIQEGDIVKLPCNPTTGDDFQAMCKWAAANHYRSEPQLSIDGNTASTALYVEVADGFHQVETFVDISEYRVLDVRGTAAPDFLTITGATFANIGTDTRAGTLYSATISVSSAIPARVVPGFAVGGQNVQGDGGADCLNGGFLVDSVAGDRLSLVVKFRSFGVAPTAFTTPDNTVTLGLTPNQLVIPKATIYAKSTGWGTGAAREGFLNAWSGGKIRLTNIGISYDGVTDAHDLISVNGTSSSVRLEDRVVLAGAGAFVTRIAYDGSLYANRSFIGGGVLARSGVYLQGGVVDLVRTMVNSSYEGVALAGPSSNIFTTQCIFNNASQGLRTTYPNASINFITSRLSRCTTALQPDKGSINLDSASSVTYCTTPATLNGGFLYGNPIVRDNTNLVPASLQVDDDGSVFYNVAGRPKDPTFQNILVATKIFTTADLGTIPANSALDLASTATATSTSYYWLNANDDVSVARSGLTLVQSGLIFEAFVTTASTQGTYYCDGTTTVTVYMTNTFVPGDSVTLDFKNDVGAAPATGTYTVVTATASQFTFTNGSAITGQGRASRDNGVITTRINNITAASFTPVATTVRFAVMRVANP
jgi:hypothetical protein